MEKPKPTKRRRSGVGQDVILYYDEASGQGLGLKDLIELRKVNKGRVPNTVTRVAEALKGLPNPQSFNPQKPDASHTTIVKLLKNRNVHTLAGDQMILLPPMEGDEGEEMPDVKAEPEVVPYYRPIYKIYGADIQIFRMLASQILEGRGSRKLYDNLILMADTHYFGNGTPAGQLGRYIAVKTVSDFLRNLNPASLPETRLPKLSEYNHGAPSDYEEYSALMAKRFPLAVWQPGMDLRSTNLLELEQEFLKVKDWFVKIQQDSDPGIIWPEGSTRADVVESDVVLAEWLLNVVASNAKDSNSAFLGDGHDYRWVGLDEMKNKSEVYTREQYLTKTRNIFATNSFAFLPAHIMIAHSHDGAPSCLDDDDSWSLMGFSPYYGNTIGLLMRAIESVEEKGYWISAFADNVYMAVKYDERILWLSIDGEKMEGCQTMADIVFYNRRIIDQFWQDHASQAWKNYLVTINPRLVVDAVVVWFNQQLQNNGMGSGSVGTGFYNTAKMIRALQHVDKLMSNGGSAVHQDEDTGGFTLTDACYKCFYQAGISVTLEATEDITGILTEPGSYSLDLLGYDAMTLELAGVLMTVPVLNYSRMVKALIFTKKNVDQTGRSTQSPYVANLLKLVKLRALYLAGGWAIDEIAELIVETCNDLTAFLGANTVNGIGGIREALALLDDDLIDELADAFGKGAKLEGTLGVRAVPTVYEAVRLAVGEIMADQVADNLARDPDTAERIGHFMPEQKAIYLAENLTGNVIPKALVQRMIDSQIQKLELIDEGWTQLPGTAEGVRLTGNWSDYLEEDEVAPSQPATKIKIPTDVATTDPFRKVGAKIKQSAELIDEYVAKETKGEDSATKKLEQRSEKETQAAFRKFNVYLGRMLEKYKWIQLEVPAPSRENPRGTRTVKTRMVEVKVPNYYVDRPETLRDPAMAAAVEFVRPLAPRFGLSIRELISLLKDQDFSFKFAK